MRLHAWTAAAAAAAGINNEAVRCAMSGGGG